MTPVAALKMAVAVSGHTTTVHPKVCKRAATNGSPELLPPHGPPTLATVMMRALAVCDGGAEGLGGGPASLVVSSSTRGPSPSVSDENCAPVVGICGGRRAVRPSSAPSGAIGRSVVVQGGGAPLCPLLLPLGVPFGEARVLGPSPM